MGAVRLQMGAEVVALRSGASDETRERGAALSLVVTALLALVAAVRAAKVRVAARAARALARGDVAQRRAKEQTARRAQRGRTHTRPRTKRGDGAAAGVPLVRCDAAQHAE